MKTNSILFCLIAFYANINMTANAQVNEQDSLALVDLYNSTHGVIWYDHTNWLTSKPVSTWYGITVTNTRVTVIYMGYNNLNGSISSSFGNLVNLNYLWLSNNHLTGSIPSSIGKLANLKELDISDNQLTGSIPTSIGNLVKLEFLDLYFNQLSGSIPSSIGNLKSIIHFAVSGNQLTGSIPSSIGRLVTIRYLLLSGNQLTGSIPSSIRKLVKLEYLYLASNQLTGTIPSYIGKFGNLLELDLGSNQLTGSIPSSIGNLVNLQFLYLDNNQLSGSIPASIGKLLNLNNLYLNNNRLSGSIPASIGNLANLYFLYLNNNELSGSIPSSLSKLSNLNWTYGLNLNRNHFTFDGMELIAKRLPLAVYAPQRLIPVDQNGNTLSVSAGGTLSNNTYEWFRYRKTGITLIATITGDSVFHPTPNGLYSVKVTNSIATQLKLHSDTIYYDQNAEPVIASTENTLQQHGKTNLFLIYPNPVKDILHIQTSEKATLTLTDQAGKILLTKIIGGNGVMNVASLLPGLYYLKNNSTEAVQKVVIAR